MSVIIRSLDVLCSGISYVGEGVKKGLKNRTIYSVTNIGVWINY